jgi:hypothetical protein
VRTDTRDSHTHGFQFILVLNEMYAGGQKNGAQMIQVPDIPTPLSLPFFFFFFFLDFKMACPFHTQEIFDNCSIGDVPADVSFIVMVDGPFTIPPPPPCNHHFILLLGLGLGFGVQGAPPFFFFFF